MTIPRSTRQRVGAGLGIWLVLSLLFILVCGPQAMAVPQIPHQFYGNVTVGGSAAPAGVTVSARIGGSEYASTTTDSQGRYGYSPSVFMVPADDPDTTAVEGGVNGQAITFYVGGVLATTSVSPVIFSSGSSTPVNLSIAALPPTPTPTAAPAPVYGAPPPVEPPPVVAPPVVAPPPPPIVEAPIALPPVSPGATGRDQAGNPVQPTVGERLAITPVDGVLSVVVPVAVAKENSLKSFEDKAAGTVFAENKLTVEVRDAKGGLQMTITATTGVAQGTGTTAVAKIVRLEMQTAPVGADYRAADPRVGTVSAVVTAELKSLPAGAGVVVTTTKAPDAAATTAFALQATQVGNRVADIAYAINITMTNLENVKDVGAATITMSVAKTWVDAVGLDRVVIARLSDDGKTTEFLSTTLVGYKDGDAVFWATSPRGLSVFALIALQAPLVTPTPALTPIPKPTPVVTPTVPPATPKPTPVVTPTAPPTAPPTVKPTPAPTVAPTPTPPPPPPPPAGPNWGLIIGIILALIIAAIVVWYFFFRVPKSK